MYIQGNSAEDDSASMDPVFISCLCIVYEWEIQQAVVFVRQSAQFETDYRHVMHTSSNSLSACGVELLFLRWRSGLAQKEE